MVHIIGHRGGRDLWAENSLAGFRELASMPVEGVEFDVHPTVDGELLVIHDPTLDRTTDRTGLVTQLRAGEHRDVLLKNSDAQCIPLLSEVLAVYADTTMELHVELKADKDGNPYPGLEAQTAAMLDAHGLAKRSILTSFNPAVLAEVRRVAPHIRTLASFDAKSSERYGLLDGLEAIAKVADIIAIEKSVLDRFWDVISPRLPKARLGVWVPNEEADLTFWLNKPIRQLTTDRPDRAVSLRRT